MSNFYDILIIVPNGMLTKFLNFKWKHFKQFSLNQYTFLKI